MLKANMGPLSALALVAVLTAKVANPIPKTASGPNIS